MTSFFYDNETNNLVLKPSSNNRTYINFNGIKGYNGSGLMSDNNGYLYVKNINANKWANISNTEINICGNLCELGGICNIYLGNLADVNFKYPIENNAILTYSNNEFVLSNNIMTNSILMNNKNNNIIVECSNSSNSTYINTANAIILNTMNTNIPNISNGLYISNNSINTNNGPYLLSYNNNTHEVTKIAMNDFNLPKTRDYWAYTAYGELTSFNTDNNKQKIILDEKVWSKIETNEQKNEYCNITTNDGVITNLNTSKVYKIDINIVLNYTGTISNSSWRLRLLSDNNDVINETCVTPGSNRMATIYLSSVLVKKTNCFCELTLRNGKISTPECSISLFITEL